MIDKVDLVREVMMDVDTKMNSEEYMEKSKKIEEQCDQIRLMDLHTKEDILKAKNAARGIPSSAEKVLLFKELISREETIKNLLLNTSQE